MRAIYRRGLDKESLPAERTESFAFQKILSFSNSAKHEATNSSGVEAVGHSYFIFYEGSTFRSIAFTYTKDLGTALENNFDAVTSGIAVSKKSYYAVCRIKVKDITSRRREYLPVPACFHLRITNSIIYKKTACNIQAVFEIPEIFS